MTVAAEARPTLIGSPTPRIAPPMPLKSLAPDLVKIASQHGIDLMPWQRTAGKYWMARDGKRFRYREVCTVVARQNGKTKMLVPRIIWGLEQGRTIVHTAQRMRIARKVFLETASTIKPELLAGRIRYANGEEEIRSKAGGSYVIIAPQRGVRGLTADDLIVDEVREFLDDEFMGAARPIVTMSSDPQIIYLSNAGFESSVVLNGLRDMADELDHLAYLEWSAAPDLDSGDMEGWAQANPALGHFPSVYDTLVQEYGRAMTAARAKGSAEFAAFETEHLCRWMQYGADKLVTPEKWAALRSDELGAIKRPSMAVALDPDGSRVSAVIAWALPDGTYSCEVVLDETAQAIDVDAVGKRLRGLAMTNRVREIAFSSATDMALSRYLPKAKALDGRSYSNATASFANLVDGGFLHWRGDVLAEDLKHVLRHPQADGTAVALRAEGAPPTTAAYAAIRALWLASAPRKIPRIG